jgi:hypothetical protein
MYARRMGPLAKSAKRTRFLDLLKFRFGTIAEAKRATGLSHDTLAGFLCYKPRRRKVTGRVRAALEKTFGLPFAEIIAKADGSLIVEVPVILIREGRGNETDRRFYSADVLRRALPKFEGVPSYLDHAPRGTPAGQRVLAGHIRDVELREIDGKAALCGTLHTSGDPRTHRLLRTAQDYNRRYPSRSYVGLSIAAKAAGETLRESGGDSLVRVCEIHSVESVDVVARAGCGGGLLPTGELVLREAAAFKFRTTPAPQPPNPPADRVRAPSSPARIELSFDDEPPRMSPFFAAEPIGTLREAAPKIDGRFDFDAPPVRMTFDFSEESRR